MSKGDDCVEEFTYGTHQEAIEIDHNLRSFDGIILCEQFYKKLLLPKFNTERVQDHVNGIRRSQQQDPRFPEFSSNAS